LQVDFRLIGQAHCFEVLRNPSRTDAKHEDHLQQADLPILIAVSERQITSLWPAIHPEPWSWLPRTPFLDRNWHLSRKATTQPNGPPRACPLLPVTWEVRSLALPLVQNPRSHQFHEWRSGFRGLLEGVCGSDDLLGKRNVLAWPQMGRIFSIVGRRKM